MNTVKVAIRVRPLLEREVIKQCKECIYVLPNKNQLIVGKNQNFVFDHVFGHAAEQVTVYEECVKPLVVSCIDGYNATVFTYGQTGSGKTFTIEGSTTAAEQQGIIRRAATDLFQFVECSDNDTKYQIKVSYLEIYLEEIRDLLNNSQDDIFIREDEHGNTIIQGLKEVPVDNMKELDKILRYGTAIRTTGATQMNAHSSRSHALLTFHVEKTSNTTATKIEVTSAKFHLVDLAGSERAQKTGNMGERFKESVYINSGLLALGNVISALTDPKRRTSHVPYRESKITRLLKDSLGGNSKTLMITCVSPANDSVEETLNSLKYAKRARSIHNNPTVNKSIIEMEMQRMESEILHLREQLKTRENSTTSASSDVIVESLTERNSTLELELSWYKGLVTQCKSSLQRFVNNNSDVAVIKETLDKLNSGEDKAGVSVVSDSVFDGGSVEQENYELKKQLQQYKQDLHNDERIFADRQIEFDQIQTDLKTQILAYQKDVQKLKANLDTPHLTTIYGHGTPRSSCKQWTGKPAGTTSDREVVFTRTHKSTLDDIHRIIHEKTQAILLQHLDTNVLASCTSSPAHECPVETELYSLTRKVKTFRDQIKQLKHVIAQQQVKLDTEEAPVQKKCTQEQRHSIVVKKSQVKPFTARPLGQSPRTSINTSLKSNAFTEGGPRNEIDKVEEQIRKILEKRRLTKEQESEVQQRDEKLLERQYITEEMRRLEHKEVRVSQVMTKDILRMKSKIDELDQSISAAVSTSVSGGLSRVEKEIAVLRKKKEDLRQKVEFISAKVNSGDLLSDKEQAEYRNLQECLETTVMALDYRTDVIADNRSNHGNTRTWEESDIDVPVNEAVVAALFRKLVLSYEQHEQLLNQNKLLELQLDTKNSDLQALHSSLIAPVV